MGIDVSEAKIRAGQLTQYRVWLEGSRRKMNEYQSQINANWSGVEVTHINTAINQVIVSLDQVIRELDGVSADVVRTANVIREEEREAERQRKIQEASDQISRIRKEIRQLKQQKDEIENYLQNGADSRLQTELEQVIRRLQKAEREDGTWQGRLDSLRR